MASALETDIEKYDIPSSEGSTHLGRRVGDVNLTEEEWQALLSPNQFQVLRRKATEPGHRLKFPDGFDDLFDSGIYLCAGCAATGHDVPLYTSKMKFDCGCGWPGFWTNVNDAVYEQRDADGRRCEILCARCDGHLGHVFRGEPFNFCTKERHCVNSLSLIFVPIGPQQRIPVGTVESRGRWEVLGGGDSGGIIVREGKELTSAAKDIRLSTRAVIEELDLVTTRLRYRLLHGTGPAEGWISTKLSSKDLVRKVKPMPGSTPSAEVSCSDLDVEPISSRITPKYTGKVAVPSPNSVSSSFPRQVLAMIRQLKAAGVPVDENDPEQVRKVLALIKDAKRQQSEQLVSKSEALPGRAETMAIADNHYILGTSMKGPWPKSFQVVVVANGCFWGSEKGMWRLPGGGIHSTAVGYAGGHTPNPTYEEVCSGRTGHTEAVQVVFDPSKISVVDILRWFWEAHDPTQGMGQGNDRGTQYRSALYYFDDDQKTLFEASKVAYEVSLKTQGKGKSDCITTEIRAAAEFSDCQVFYYAEDHHQQYLAKPGAQPYCSAQPQEVPLPAFQRWVPDQLQSKYRPMLPEEFWKLHSPVPHCVLESPSEPIRWP